MIHSLGVEVVSVVSLASSDGWWSFLRDRRSTRWPSLRGCGVKERESGRVERFVGFRGLELRVSRFRSPGKSAWAET